jgi:phosphate transport system substrate-binding protein
VHPGNRVSTLTVDQVRALFSGRVRDWSQVGGAPGPVVLHARDDRSGTFDTFKSLVMGEAALSAAATRYESTEQLAAAVAADPQAIGFVGLAGVGSAKPLALSERGTVPMAPTALSVATEDYVLARRLFLYSAARPRAEVQALIDFALGPSGQQVVADVGFVPQDIRALDQRAPEHQDYRALVAGARRLSLNFRFGEGAAVLDNKAVEDIERLTRFMSAPRQGGHELLLIGFADRSEATPYLALSLSNDRVDLVAAELRTKGLRVARQRRLGQIAPVASNDTLQGRLRNRRVEVWIRPVGAANAVGGQR